MLYDAASNIIKLCTFFADIFRDEFPNLDNLLDYIFNDTADSTILNRDAAQKILDEIPDEILLPTENLLRTMEKRDHVFNEKFLNLTKVSEKSNMNTKHTTDNLDSQANVGTVEYNVELDTITVPIVTPDTLSKTPVNTAKSGVFVNNHSCSLVQSDMPSESIKTTIEPSADCIAGFPPAQSSLQCNMISQPSPSYESTSAPVSGIPLSLPGSFESTFENLDNRKRNFVEASKPAEAMVSACKKRVEQPCSSKDVGSFVDEGIFPLFAVAASASVSSTVDDEMRSVATTLGRTPRVCGPSKEARLNMLENWLERENEELKAQVQELSREIEFLRNYIVRKLRGQCYYCKK